MGGVVPHARAYQGPADRRKRRRFLIEIGAGDCIRGVASNEVSFERLPRVELTYQKLQAASSTICAWPVTFTFFQILAILPLGATRKVVRSTPIYFFPYMLFSFQTP